MGIDALIHKARRKRDRWRKVEHRKNVNARELAETLEEVRDEKRHKRSVRSKLRRFILHPGWGQKQRDKRREQLADQIEDLEGQEDRLVERIDEVREQSAHAEHLKDFYAKRLGRLRKRRKEMADDKDRLTKDFHVREFDCRNGARVPEGIIPELRKLCEDHLQPLRDSGGSVHINSGYRTAAYNAAIGGASQSYHIYDLRLTGPAADHIQAGRSAGAVANWHDAHNAPDGMGRYATFTHIDSRGYRSRWWG